MNRLAWWLLYQYRNWTLEKTERAINNGQSREIGNFEYTRHKTKTKKTKNTTQKLKRWAPRTLVVMPYLQKWWNKMKNNNHIVTTVLKSNKKSRINIGEIDTHSIHIHDHSFSWQDIYFNKKWRASTSLKATITTVILT